MPRLDRRSSPPEARVQVKTVGSGVDTIRMRLSAADRLARHPQAAFICVVVANELQKFESLYVLHVIGDLLSLILKEVRRCVATNSLDINRKFLTMRFKKFCKQTDGSAEALRERFAIACGKDPDVYFQMKKEQKANLGFISHRYSGQFTLVAQNQADAVDVMLGIKTGWAKNFTVDEVRWGISLPEPQIPKSAQIRILPTPRKGEIVIRAGNEKMTLKVDVFFPPIPDLPRKFWKLRLSSDLIEMVLDFTNEKVDLTTGSSDDRAAPVRKHLQINKLRRILMLPGRFEVSVEGKRLIGSVFAPDVSDISRAQAQLNHQMLVHLERVLSQGDANDLFMTVSEINRHAAKVAFLHHVISSAGAKMTLGFVPNPSAHLPPQDVSLEMLLLDFLRYDLGSVAFAAVGNASIRDMGGKMVIEITDLNAREVRLIDGHQESQEEFAKAMEAETGLDFIINVSGMAAPDCTEENTT